MSRSFFTDEGMDLNSVNVLLYGDFPDLARRCLNSIIDTIDVGYVTDIRIGLNAVGERTRAIAIDAAYKSPVVTRLYEEEHRQNVMKYPLMRRMLHDPDNPITAERAMWFDDDSFVTGGKGFWKRTAEICKGSAVAGQKWRPSYSWTPKELEMIRKQAWFVKDFGERPTFTTGGWWTASMEFLRKWDYPFLSLRHNGGDVILGELCRQQGVTVRDFCEGVAINADANGVGCRSKRRGLTSPRPFQFDNTDLDHHDFRVLISTFDEDKVTRD